MENEPQRFEIPDPTKEMRVNLASSLESYANPEEHQALESFKAGSFMVPGETFSTVRNLIERSDEETKQQLLIDFDEIIKKGM